MAASGQLGYRMVCGVGGVAANSASADLERACSLAGQLSAPFVLWEHAARVGCQGIYEYLLGKRGDLYLTPMPP
jgi:hypothetical protein